MNSIDSSLGKYVELFIIDREVSGCLFYRDINDRLLTNQEDIRIQCCSSPIATLWGFYKELGLKNDEEEFRLIQGGSEIRIQPFERYWGMMIITDFWEDETYLYANPIVEEVYNSDISNLFDLAQLLLKTSGVGNENETIRLVRKGFELRRDPVKPENITVIDGVTPNYNRGYTLTNLLLNDVLESVSLFPEALSTYLKTGSTAGFLGLNNIIESRTIQLKEEVFLGYLDSIILEALSRNLLVEELLNCQTFMKEYELEAKTKYEAMKDDMKDSIENIKSLTMQISNNQSTIKELKEKNDEIVNEFEDTNEQLHDSVKQIRQNLVEKVIDVFQNTHNYKYEIRNYLKESSLVNSEIKDCISKVNGQAINNWALFKVPMIVSSALNIFKNQN